MEHGSGHMNTKDKNTNKADDRSVYDLSTPILDRYYRRMRKYIRFPRYYKKALNW
jgi:hypothetical protein